MPHEPPPAHDSAGNAAPIYSFEGQYLPLEAARYFASHYFTDPPREVESVLASGAGTDQYWIFDLKDGVHTYLMTFDFKQETWRVYVHESK